MSFRTIHFLDTVTSPLPPDVGGMGRLVGVRQWRLHIRATIPEDDAGMKEPISTQWDETHLAEAHEVAGPRQRPVAHTPERYIPRSYGSLSSDEEQDHIEQPYERGYACCPKKIMTHGLPPRQNHVDGGGSNRIT